MLKHLAVKANRFLPLTQHLPWAPAQFLFFLKKQTSPRCICSTQEGSPQSPLSLFLPPLEPTLLKLLLSVTSTLSNTAFHLPWLIWRTGWLLPFLSLLCWFLRSDHPLIPGESVLNLFPVSGYTRWSLPVPTPQFVSSAQTSPLKSRLRYPAAFLTPVLWWVIGILTLH